MAVRTLRWTRHHRLMAPLAHLVRPFLAKPSDLSPLPIMARLATVVLITVLFVIENNLTVCSGKSYDITS